MKRIESLLLSLALCLVLLTACKSTQQVTTSNYPDWLQEKISVLNERHCEITLFDFDGDSFYAVFVKGPEKSYDMNRTTIYDANGEVYLSLGGPRKRSDKEIQFFNKAQNKGVIWQSDIAREKNKD
ncbi:MAG: hypothetical protein IKJ79_06525 [Bacteroidaceae bacterium]|nr:hypothetical protein [Bacteroidaceae bacterium]